MGEYVLDLRIWLNFLFLELSCKENLSAEWLEVDGLGGYASSTLSGAHSRRYHGMLIAAPSSHHAARYVMVSRFDETLYLKDGRYPLFERRYRDVSDPENSSFLVEYHQEDHPVFRYEIQEANQRVLLQKSILALHEKNTVLIRYQLIESAQEISLTFEPFMATRYFHDLQLSPSARYESRWSYETLEIHCPLKLPNCLIVVPKAERIETADWYHHFLYSEEKQRGFDAEESVFRIATLSKTVSPGDEFFVALSTEDMTDDERTQEALKAAFSSELERRKDFSVLSLAADKHIVTRRSQGVHRKTIIAGYPWFSDWGRDTMISLPGLLLDTERTEEAKAVLQSYAAVVDQGMIPNRFPDDDATPEYNSVDASLWFISATYSYLQATGDFSFIEKSLFLKLQEIEESYRTGTRYGISEEKSTGLLLAGSGQDQLTWMDARIDGKAITPRHGKAVEINALWYNAQRIMSVFSEQAGHAELATLYGSQAGRIEESFQEAFWCDEQQFFADVVSESGERDMSCRPNQLFALGLHFPMSSEAQARSVLRHVRERLLTPVGLRTLCPNNPKYVGVYVGGSFERDSAYHQGTVWPWLLGVYGDAVMRFGDDSMKHELQVILSELEVQLSTHGIGTLSEIYDGNAPHTPRGCISQAWSVAEVLRALKRVLEE